jgi:hypothetical protein
MSTANIEGEENITPAEEPKDEIDLLFTYHAPTQEQVQQYANIRAKAMELARVIHANCPGSPDRTASMRLLREAVMTANASIATGGGFYK